MNVRSFQLSDYASVTRLLQEVLSEACYEETIAAFAKQLAWDSELVLIAQEGETAVGVIIGTIDNNNGYYYRIAVHPDFQRKGIGRTMVQALKGRFMQRKVQRILIGVDQHNEPILSLFQKAGYTVNDFTRSMSRLSIVGG